VWCVDFYRYRWIYIENIEKLIKFFALRIYLANFVALYCIWHNHCTFLHERQSDICHFLSSWSIYI